MDSAQDNPAQVLPPNRVLVRTSWTLAISAVTVWLLHFAGYLDLGRNPYEYESMILMAFTILLFCSVVFALWARFGFLKSLLVWFAGSLGAVICSVIFFIIIREISLDEFPNLGVVEVVGMGLFGVTIAGVACSARFVAELILHPVREHPQYGVMVVLVVTGSLACLMSPFAIHRSIEYGFGSLIVILVGLFAYACAAPIFIDKRRVPRVPNRIGIPIWIGWCIWMPYLEPSKLRYLTPAIPILIMFNSILLYLAWRNSRPQLPAPANSDAV
jgi:hypothetical protein